MVGRRFGRHPDAAGLGLADHADAARGREMGDVDGRARGLGQDDVAGDHDLLGGGGDAGEAEPLGDPGPRSSTPPSKRARSSQWSMTKAPASSAAAMARRMIRLSATGRPSSEKATAPAATRPAMSTSSVPFEAPRDRGDGQDVGQTCPPGFGPGCAP